MIEAPAELTQAALPATWVADVTDEDILLGKRLDGTQCPIVRSALRYLALNCGIGPDAELHVDHYWLYMFDGDRQVARWHHNGDSFILSFDNGLPTEPTSVRMEIVHE